MRHTFLNLISSLVLIQGIPADLAAQEPKSPAAARVPATIVLSDRLPANSRFVVKRLPGRARHDVIVLATDASEGELGLAIRTLLSVRQKDGDIPAETKTLRMRPSTSIQSERAPFPWVGRVLADVQRADRIEIEGVGFGRAVQIWLPRQNRTRLPRPKPQA